MDIKVLIGFHKKAPVLLADDIFCPIFLNAKKADEKEIKALQKECEAAGGGLLRDDEVPDKTRGFDIKDLFTLSQKPYPKEISELNLYFCEATALYWAWQNLEADYVGYMHYRRYFDFSIKEAHGRAYTTLYNDELKNFNTLIKSENLPKICKRADIIKAVECHNSMYQNLDKNHLQNIMEWNGIINESSTKIPQPMKDFELCLAIIKERYPSMQTAIDKVFNGNCLSYWNMFVMKKELFDEYCEWLFDVLFHFIQKNGLGQARAMAYYTEMIFNIWLEYKQLQKPELRIFNLPVYFVDFVNDKSKKKPWFGWHTENNKKRFFLFRIRVYKKKVM